MEAQGKIEREELLEEIALALKDEFIATVGREDGALVLAFPGGQTFRLALEEA